MLGVNSSSSHRSMGSQRAAKASVVCSASQRFIVPNSVLMISTMAVAGAALGALKTTSVGYRVGSAMASLWVSAGVLVHGTQECLQQGHRLRGAGEIGIGVLSLAFAAYQAKSYLKERAEERAAFVSTLSKVSQMYQEGIELQSEALKTQSEALKKMGELNTGCWENVGSQEQQLNTYKTIFSQYETTLKEYNEALEVYFKHQEDFFTNMKSPHLFENYKVH